MLVNLGVVVGVDVAAGIDAFDVLKKLGIDRHHILEVAVDRAILNHPDLVVALDDRRLDLTRTILNHLERILAVIDDPLPCLFDTGRAEAVRHTRPTKGRLRLLPRLLKRLL